MFFFYLTLAIKAIKAIELGHQRSYQIDGRGNCPDETDLLVIDRLPEELMGQLDESENTSS